MLTNDERWILKCPEKIFGVVSLLAPMHSDWQKGQPCYEGLPKINKKKYSFINSCFEKIEF